MGQQQASTDLFGSQFEAIRKAIQDEMPASQYFDNVFTLAR
jgi:hypothetical protein